MEEDKDVHLLDHLDDGWVVHGGGHGGHAGAGGGGGAGQIVGAWLLARRALGLEGDDHGVVLALVANHHDVRDGLAEHLDVVLDRHGSDVLTASTNDELLVPEREMRK